MAGLGASGAGLGPLSTGSRVGHRPSPQPRAERPPSNTGGAMGGRKGGLGLLPHDGEVRSLGSGPRPLSALPSCVPFRGAHASPVLIPGDGHRPRAAPRLCPGRAVVVWRAGPLPILSTCLPVTQGSCLPPGAFLAVRLPFLPARGLGDPPFPSQDWPRGTHTAPLVSRPSVPAGLPPWAERATRWGGVRRLCGNKQRL